VRHGCVLSPSVFKLYTEEVLRELEEMNGVNVSVVNINNVRYTDDTVLQHRFTRISNGNK